MLFYRQLVSLVSINTLMNISGAKQKYISSSCFKQSSKMDPKEYVYKYKSFIVNHEAQYIEQNN